MRNVALGETVKVYFNVKLINGDPALTEIGQPQISINGAAFTDNYISTLISVGFGRYYANFSTEGLAVGDVIVTRYKSGITQETEGDKFLIGEALSNSSITHYGTLQDANLYFSQQLNVRYWDRANDANKLRALISATQIIDRLNYYGDKTDENQLLQFPRDEADTVPDDIVKATYIVGLKLLEGYDPDIEAQNMMVEMSKYESVQTYFDRSYIPEWIRAGIPSQKAWAYLKPYLYNPREINLERV